MTAPLIVWRLAPPGGVVTTVGGLVLRIYLSRDRWTFEAEIAGRPFATDALKSENLLEAQDEAIKKVWIAMRRYRYVLEEIELPLFATIREKDPKW